MRERPVVLARRAARLSLFSHHFVDHAKSARISVVITKTNAAESESVAIKAVTTPRHDAPSSIAIPPWTDFAARSQHT